MDSDVFSVYIECSVQSMPPDEDVSGLDVGAVGVLSIRDNDHLQPYYLLLGICIFYVLRTQSLDNSLMVFWPAL